MQAAREVSRTTTIVCERDHFKPVRELDEHDVIRKRSNRYAPNVRIRYVRHAATGVGK
jgi:hypothetical protein